MLLLLRPGNVKSLTNTANTIFYVALKPQLPKSCMFPLPKHAKSKRGLQYITRILYVPLLEP